PSQPHLHEYDCHGLGNENTNANQVYDDQAGGALRAGELIVEISDQTERIIPPAKEQRGLNPADGEHRSVFREEKEAPPQAAVFRMEAGDQLGFALGQVKWCTLV